MLNHDPDYKIFKGKIEPDFDTFVELSKQGNLIPLTASMLGDRVTPVTLFEAVKSQPYAYLLESVEHGIDSLQTGRYSFVGFNPRYVYQIKKGKIWREDAEGNRTDYGDASPMQVLRDQMNAYTPVEIEGMPPFLGGLVGYMGYDIIREFERIPDDNPTDIDLPDAMLMLSESVICIDHVRRRLSLLANAHLKDGETSEDVYDAAARQLFEMRKLLSEHAGPQPTPDWSNGSSRPADGAAAINEHDITSEFGDLPALGAVKSSLSKQQLHDLVNKAKEYILAGDAFQIVGSQRFHTQFNCDPFDIYRSLRDVNPSPYMYYLQFKDWKIAGSSPEILVKLEDGEVQLRPIAGTRPRGKDIADDKALELDLLDDQKERAEHVMLVDLGRNDVGRVCEPGSVEVDQLMVIERYSHVMHIVSNVTGHIKPGYDAFDLLGASFPAGTVSGAPKIRAMEIIDELEPVRRGAYAGTVCYFSFNGNLDSCITIRTAVINGNDAYVQAGGGWVADSVPETEYQETLNKARGVLRAINQAEAGLD
jgi:anthranilate synthase component 1